MTWNSLPDFIRVQRAAQTVLGVYLKRTCSRDTSASSALRVLNAIKIHALTHSLIYIGNPDLSFFDQHSLVCSVMLSLGLGLVSFGLGLEPCGLVNNTEFVWRDLCG